MFKRLISRDFLSYVAFSMLLLLVAIFLRFHDLSSRSLWFDEAITANNSQGTLGETLSNTRHQNSNPILYPMLLYFVQKIDASATAVRLPSAIASVLVILVILSTPRVGVDKRIAFLAALLLTFSASQIQYAQEVREYSLSVLVAAVMVYSYFLELQNENKRFLLLSTVFLAPLVQYGLVLFAAAVLLSIGVERLCNDNWRKAASSVLLPGIFLCAGGIISAWLTLRFQWAWVSPQSHIARHYYEGGLGDVKALAVFLEESAAAFLLFIMPGPLVLGLAIPAFGFASYHCAKGLRCERHSLQLGIIAVLIAVVASIARVYPFGGIRQDIFLAPAVALVFAASYLSVSQAFAESDKAVWIVICIAFTLCAGMRDIYGRNPYAEVEDIKSIIEELDKQASSKDAVYVYYSARPALEFYNVRGDNFFYGEEHREHPEKYLEEISRSIEPQFDKIWLVFSHAKDDEKFIIDHLESLWILKEAAIAKGASLYLGIRRTRYND